MDVRRMKKVPDGQDKPHQKVFVVVFEAFEVFVPGQKLKKLKQIYYY